MKLKKVIFYCFVISLMFSGDVFAKTKHVPIEYIIEMTMRNLEESVQKIEAENLEIELSNQALQRAIDRLKERFVLMKKEQVRAQQKINELKGIKKGQDVEFREEKLETSNQNFIALDQEYRTVLERISASQQKKKKLLDEIETVQKEIEKIKNNLKEFDQSELKQDLGQGISDHQFNDLIAKIEFLKRAKSDLEGFPYQKIMLLEEANMQLMKQLEEKQNELSQMKSQHRSEKKVFEKEQVEHTEELKKIAASISDLERIEKQYQEKILELSEAEKEFDQTKEKITSELTELEKELNALQKKNKNYRKILQRLKGL